MASFLKHPTVKELARIMSKGVFSSQKPRQTHTLMFSLGPMWERVSKGRPQADCVSDSLLLSKEWANSAMPLSGPDNSQKQARAGSELQIQVSGNPESRRWSALGEWSTGSNTKQEAIGFQMEQTAQRKAYSVVLSKIHNNVSFTFVPLMSFLTEKLCYMLDSQALAFKATFDKSFI